MLFCQLAMLLYICTPQVLTQAEVAHLVEHDLAKVGVAGSSPVFRSNPALQRDFFSPEGGPRWWNW
jgi:hypothetical protein